ncbi:thermonuclease family protein [Candidatus Saccharibacteria bacterium]|nr:thermonuclease family protein [Candidatus Saccharibacteria bacterium]
MSRYRTRRGVLSIIIFVLSVGYIFATQSGWLKDTAKTAQQNDPGLYAIEHFVDGDTIAVNMNGSIETVRMIGIDTPETHRPNTPVQCYGPEAAAFTKQLIGQNKVRLQADSLDTNRDRYGRLLRYVYLPDGRMVETELLTHGYAFAYTQFPFEKTDQFSEYAQAASDAKKGLWGACQVTTETNGRQQTNNAN